MNIFYSELAENPAYYSFGYSVYGELEPGDSIADAYEKGFLPCVIAKDQPERLMYQTRGVRIRAQEFTRRHYHHRVVRKAEALGAIEITLHPIATFATDEAFIAFFLRYFSFRFGKDAMPEARLRAILNSGWITHIREYRINGAGAAYTLEHHGDSYVHVFYHAYEKKHEHAHLGSYLYTRLLEEIKKEGKRYLYLGVTYGPWMRYKANFAPLEYWTGKEWIPDPNGKKLKALLGEGLSLIPYVDRFRAALQTFYQAPTVPGFTREARFLQSALDGAPRLTLLMLLVPILLVLFVVGQSFF